MNSHYVLPAVAAWLVFVASASSAEPTLEEELRQLRREMARARTSLIEMTGLLERMQRQVNRLEQRARLQETGLRFPIEVERAMLPGRPTLPKAR